MYLKSPEKSDFNRNLNIRYFKFVKTIFFKKKLFRDFDEKISLFTYLDKFDFALNTKIKKNLVKKFYFQKLIFAKSQKYLKSLHVLQFFPFKFSTFSKKNLKTIYTIINFQKVDVFNYVLEFILFYFYNEIKNANYNKNFKFLNESFFIPKKEKMPKFPALANKLNINKTLFNSNTFLKNPTSFVTQYYLKQISLVDQTSLLTHCENLHDQFEFLEILNKTQYLKLLNSFFYSYFIELNLKLYKLTNHSTLKKLKLMKKFKILNSKNDYFKNDICIKLFLIFLIKNNLDKQTQKKNIFKAFKTSKKSLSYNAKKIDIDVHELDFYFIKQLFYKFYSYYLNKGLKDWFALFNFKKFYHRVIINLLIKPLSKKNSLLTTYKSNMLSLKKLKYNFLFFKPSKIFKLDLFFCNSKNVNFNILSIIFLEIIFFDNFNWNILNKLTKNALISLNLSNFSFYLKNQSSTLFLQISQIKWYSNNPAQFEKKVFFLLQKNYLFLLKKNYPRILSQFFSKLEKLEFFLAQLNRMKRKKFNIFLKESGIKTKELIFYLFNNKKEKLKLNIFNFVIYFYVPINCFSTRLTNFSNILFPVFILLIEANTEIYFFTKIALKFIWFKKILVCFTVHIDKNLPRCYSLNLLSVNIDKNTFNKTTPVFIKNLLKIKNKNNLKEKVFFEFSEIIFGIFLVYFTSVSNEFKIMHYLKILKILIKKSSTQNQKTLMKKLNLKMYSWCYDNRFTHNLNDIIYLDKKFMDFLWNWACRRHSNKSKKWIKIKYFSKYNQKNLIFTNSRLTTNNFELFKSLSLQVIYLPLHNEILKNLKNYKKEQN